MIEAFLEVFQTTALASIVAAASPMLFATIGETITEKAGVINLSLDGSIMISALAGFVVAVETGNVWLGFPAAGAVGMAVALLVAFSSIRLRLNQVAVGFVLALLCTELSVFLGNGYVGRPPVGVPAWEIPLLADIPFFGRVLFDHNVIVYLSLVLVLAAYVFMYRTRFGLALQGVGERPEAAHARGIAVNFQRYLYTGVGGFLVGVAGAAFSLDVKLGWSDKPTRNFGWIALAIVIFGGWHPFRVATGVFLFGVLQVLALKLQPELPNLTQVLPILPFPLMIFTLLLVNREWLRKAMDRIPALRAIFRSDPPGGLGIPFEVE